MMLFACGGRPSKRSSKKTPTIFQLNDLPAELLYEVFARLPLLDRFRVGLVCRRWNTITRNKNSLWQALDFRYHFGKHERLSPGNALPVKSFKHVLAFSNAALTSLSCSNSQVDFCSLCDSDLISSSCSDLRLRLYAADEGWPQSGSVISSLFANLRSLAIEILDIDARQPAGQDVMPGRFIEAIAHLPLEILKVVVNFGMDAVFSDLHRLSASFSNLRSLSLSITNDVTPANLQMFAVGPLIRQLSSFSCFDYRRPETTTLNPVLLSPVNMLVNGGQLELHEFEFHCCSGLSYVTIDLPNVVESFRPCLTRLILNVNFHSEDHVIADTISSSTCFAELVELCISGRDSVAQAISNNCKKLERLEMRCVPAASISERGLGALAVGLPRLISCYSNLLTVSDSKSFDDVSLWSTFNARKWRCQNRSSNGYVSRECLRDENLTLPPAVGLDVDLGAANKGTVEKLTQLVNALPQLHSLCVKCNFSLNRLELAELLTEFSGIDHLEIYFRSEFRLTMPETVTDCPLTASKLTSLRLDEANNDVASVIAGSCTNLRRLELWARRSNTRLTTKGLVRVITTLKSLEIFVVRSARSEPPPSYSKLVIGIAERKYFGNIQYIDLKVIGEELCLTKTQFSMLRKIFPQDSRERLWSRFETSSVPSNF